MKLRIADGTVIDGTGGEPFRGDIVVEGDRIVGIERESRECLEARTKARTEGELIDADGCLVTPGFIDAHSHSDAYLILEPQAPSKVTQGITTEINGQCGGSAAPRYGEARLSSDWAALLGERLTWRSMAEYRSAFEKAKPLINTIQFVGHNTLRSSVVGYAGRKATNEELREMERLLERSMEEGGWGFTTGLIYQPGKYSTREEVIALAKVAAKLGGIYATHMRSEGDGILEAIDEVIELTKASGIKAEISHLKTSGRKNWGKIDAVIEKIDAGIDAGLLLGSDRYPYCAAGTDLDVVLPDWAGEGGSPMEMERLADEGLRQRIVDEINASERDWSEVMIGGTWSDATKQFSGRRISEIDADSPGELVCSILEKDGCKTGAFFFGMSEDNLERIYSMPWIVPGSDASLRAPWGPLGADYPHPRAYGTMPEFYRRLRKLGFSREATIARMTSVPARRFGIAGRGIIEKGAFADLLVWKEEDFRATATYDVPHSFTRGMKAVLVNGKMVFDGKTFGESGAGRFLERRG